MAGCSGGGSTAPAPLPVSTPTPTPPPGSSTQGTLYVAGIDEVAAFPITAQGSATPSLTLTGLAGLGTGAGNWTRVAAVGGTGETFLVSIQTQVAAIQQPTQWRCTLNVYSTSTAGSANLVNAPPCPGDFYAAVVVGRTNGDIDYLAAFYGAPAEVIRLHAGGSSVTRLVAATGQSFQTFAEDQAGNIYVANGSTVLEYSGTSDVAASVPTRTISLAGSPSVLAVAPDGTIYAGLNDPAAIVAIPVSGSTRTFGSYPSGARIGGLATDSAGDVYVGINGPASNQTEVDTYAPNTGTPMRALANAVPSSTRSFAPLQINGIAVAQ